jgi:membrane protein implicated in regulation of membrane protease activity
VFLIVAVVLLLVLPWPWSLVGFVVSLVLFFGELLFWHRRVRGRRKEVGAQTLIGKAAAVVSTCRPDGQVRLSGEIWTARCDGGADPGETVTVVGRDGLTLVVERTPGTTRPQ